MPGISKDLAILIRCTTCIAIFLCAISLAVATPKPIDSYKATFKKNQTPAEILKLKKGEFRVKGSLKHALKKLQNRIGLKIFVDWQALKQANLSPKIQISFYSTNAPASELLSLLLVHVQKPGKPIGWYLDNNKIVITDNDTVFEFHKNMRDKKFADDRRVSKGRTQKKRDTTKKRSNRKTGKLERKRSEVKMPGQKLAEVLNYIQQAGDFPIEVNWRALDVSGVKKSTRIDLQLRNVTIEQLLDVIMLNLNAGKNKYEKIYWVVHKGRVLISTGAELDKIMQTRFFEVAQMLQPVLEGGQMTIGNAQAYIAGYEPIVGANVVAYKPIVAYAFSGATLKLPSAADRARRDISARKRLELGLIETVKSFLDEDHWRPAGKGSVTIFRKRLIITQTLLGWKLLEQQKR